MKKQKELNGEIIVSRIVESFSIEGTAWKVDGWLRIDVRLYIYIFWPTSEFLSEKIDEIAETWDWMNTKRAHTVCMVGLWVSLLFFFFDSLLTKQSCQPVNLAGQSEWHWRFLFDPFYFSKTQFHSIEKKNAMVTLDPSSITCEPSIYCLLRPMVITPAKKGAPFSLWNSQRWLKSFPIFSITTPNNSLCHKIKLSIWRENYFLSFAIFFFEIIIFLHHKYNYILLTFIYKSNTIINFIIIIPIVYNF